MLHRTKASLFFVSPKSTFRHRPHEVRLAQAKGGALQWRQED